MSTVTPPAEHRVILGNVRWSTYLALLNDDANPRGRIAYDNGVLEITSPSRFHESIKTLLGRMLETFFLETDIDVLSAGSTTFKRDDLEKGFEPDECYYLQNAAAVRGKEEVDLTVEPPPDLILEVDISRSSMNKLGICQSLGVPEVWRYEGDWLHVYVLHDDKYEEMKQSSVLPQLPIEKLMEFLKQRTELTETQLVRSFRDGVRSEFAG